MAARRDDVADALSDELGVDAVAWSDVAATEADLYVNATPVGSRPDDPPALPESVLANRPLVFDCVYRVGQDTSTVTAARQARCPVVTGLEMFAAQAVRQARLFGVGDARIEEIQAMLSGGEAA